MEILGQGGEFTFARRLVSGRVVDVALAGVRVLIGDRRVPSAPAPVLSNRADRVHLVVPVGGQDLLRVGAAHEGEPLLHVPDDQLAVDVDGKQVLADGAELDNGYFGSICWEGFELLPGVSLEYSYLVGSSNSQ